MITYSESFRRTRFENSVIAAKEICEENGIILNYKISRLQKIV